jgi:hypothetical protein
MIIGLTGFAGSGKDTIGNELVSRGFTRLSFAAPLKELALKCDPVVTWFPDGTFQRLSQAVQSVGWDRAKFEVYDVRRFLQGLGVGAREIFGADFWVDQVIRQIEQLAYRDKVENFVITDVRFPNEAEMVRKYDGLVVQVQRKGVGPVNDHVSERPIDPSLIDLWVQNYGTLKEVPVLADWLLADVQRLLDSRLERARVDRALRDEWPIYETETGHPVEEDQGGNTDLAGAREAEELYGICPSCGGSGFFGTCTDCGYDPARRNQ